MTEPYIAQIFNVGFNFAPRNYATCDGQTLMIAQNAALFSLVGTTYGGNGTQTFQLPNLQGRAAVHRGNGPGLSGYVQGQIAGSESVTLTTSNLAPHTHAAVFTPGTSTFNGVNTRATTATPTAGYQLGRATDGSPDPNSIPWIYTPATTANLVAMGGLNVAGSVSNTPIGNNQPLNILRPYQVILSIIALTGIFPSRN